MLEPSLDSTNLKGPVPIGLLVAASTFVQSSSVSYKCCGRIALPYHARFETNAAFASLILITKCGYHPGIPIESTADNADARNPSDSIIFS